ncbi:hypothetical protein Trydic_g18430, partial [Trypoxylus dichotomus]
TIWMKCSSEKPIFVPACNSTIDHHADLVLEFNIIEATGG